MMSTSHAPQDRGGTSLLQLVENRCDTNREVDTGWGDVLIWFDHSKASSQSAAVRETNNHGETPLHIILQNSSTSPTHQKQILDIVEKIRQVNADVFKVQDSRGCLPLHNACRAAEESSFEVIKAIIEAYPAGLGVKCKNTGRKNTFKHTPFGWDCNISVGASFTEFIQYIVREDLCESGSNKGTVRMRKSRHRMLGHCKNYVPLDILKKGMLNKKTLESSAMIRWLNEMPCKRTLVCGMVLELYMHMAWICTFVYTTALHIEEGEQLQGWEPIALLVFAGYFFLQEFYQLYRFVKTNAALSYWLDLWNWIDLTTAGLVTASAIKFLQNDETKQTDHLLMCTGFFQFVLLVSYLKKTFFPFSAFVSGIIKIMLGLIPFLVISAITLFAFAYMYYVQGYDGPATYDPFAHDEDWPYKSMWTSFQTIYAPFAEGPEGNTSILDFLFGIAIVIVLLNVVIAVVSEAWIEATQEANNAFWSYRLDLILEKTRGIDEIAQYPVFCGCFKGLDEYYINIETVGTTLDELKQRLVLTYRERGTFSCIVIITKSIGFIILGFPTFGILWPKFFRQMLFTPPKPKEDDAKLQMDELASQIAECKELASDRDAGYKKLESDIASYRKEVQELGDMMKLQIELMQKLLSKEDATVPQDSKKLTEVYGEEGVDISRVSTVASKHR